MCGITGFYLQGKDFNKSQLIENLTSMTRKLDHRGPDDSGIWLDNSNKIGFGQTRLSIRDLSKNGSQPMFSSCKRYVIIYNGEIYDTENTKTILTKQNVILKSNTDTEILIESISRFGLIKAIKKTNGMFAFALYDIFKKKLYLVRDRLGIKPLFYFQNKDSVAFASEIKAIKKFFNFKSSINIKALNSYLKFGFNRNNTSIFENVNQVKPGELIEIDENLGMKKIIYWETNHFLKNNNNHFENNVLELESLIKNSVKIRLESDVEVGSFLSGGIDSSLISMLMSKVSKKRINTFSVGFKEKDFDESEDAKKISKFIGSNHHEIQIDEKNLISIFDDLPNIYDEPFADSSQIPTAIVSAYSKKYAGVILSGDGGDELFGGYTRYLDANNHFEKKIDVRIFLKKIIGNTILNLNPKLIRFAEKFLDQKNLISRSNQFLKFQETTKKSYPDFLCQWNSLADILSNKFININDDVNIKLEKIKNNFEKFMAYDLKEYLPNDILTKVDRASMRYGLEVRVPFLDYRIVEFALNLNIDNKIDGNNQKNILKKILEKNMPKKLIKNKKVGFGIPIDEWLRSSLKERVRYLLSDECLDRNPFVNKKNIQKLWKEHEDNIHNHGIKLWNIISLQNWINHNTKFLKNF